MLYFSCINVNKFWSDLNKLFTKSVALIPCVNSQVCARYVNLLPKYELSKFENIEIFSNNFLKKIFVINNLKCATN